jgi:RNA recognition motif-containing protein
MAPIKGYTFYSLSTADFAVIVASRLFGLLLFSSCRRVAPAMIRRRGGAFTDEESSSEKSEEDAFSVLQSRATKGKAGRAKSKPVQTAVLTTSIVDTVLTTAAAAPLPTVNTSSMKRHHGSSDSRKAKMDALLQELEAEKVTSPSRPFVPQKKGSFVQPGQEHLTTNIFVGNLAPSITEEQMTELFRQFGEHSIDDIAWKMLFYGRTKCENDLCDTHQCRELLCVYFVDKFQSILASR